MVKNHPEELLLNADGSKQKISLLERFRYPANKAVIERHRQLVIKIIRDWNDDGLNWMVCTSTVSRRVSIRLTIMPGRRNRWRISRSSSR
jgi:hypothetical protein